MKLPNGHRAVVEAGKVRDYLLSSEHPIGRAKARFFRGLGFRQAEWAVLESSLRSLAVEGRAEAEDATRYGQKYTVTGILIGPGGKSAWIVSVWIVLVGDEVPRFVTAYPEEDR
jgi:hypothetical protein